MLTPVTVHAHDETVLVLHAHLVVNVLLDAASEEPLETECKKNENKCFGENLEYSCGSQGSEIREVKCLVSHRTLQPSQAWTP